MGTSAECIEGLVLDFLTQLTTANDPETEHPRIQLKLIDQRKESKHRTLTYPKKAKHGSFRPFAQVFQTLDLCHQAVSDDTPMTKRDLYYHNPVLFGSQATADKLVDDLASTFNLERSALNIRAASKGLVCGVALRIHLKSGEAISCSDSEAVLIPTRDAIQSLSLEFPIRWILIVEKDAVFQTLRHDGICQHPEMPGPGLLLTGKGYPDVATRYLVNLLARIVPKSTPICGLVDGDPFGLDILSVYTYGSHAMQADSMALATPRIQWIGISSADFADFSIDDGKMIPITAHDEKKAYSMLNRPAQALPTLWKKELSRMLHTRRKVELEILSSGPQPGETLDEGRALSMFSTLRPISRYVQDKVAAAIDSHDQQ